MIFKVLTFKELLDKKFNIPSYQRGYRWEKENVEALLNDIKEFSHKEKEPDEFYCLQPVVVKINKKLSEKKGEKVYDLLDGQQRLTTLWLILNSPKFKTIWDALDSEHPTPYSLEYESRDNLFVEALNSKADPLRNIDLFYLKMAISTIDNWKGSPLDILNTVVPNMPALKTDNVRIIWYEFEQDANIDKGKQSSSINVFSRLNYGKIPLTDTELIKALILQSDIYPLEDCLHNRGVMKEHLFRIATEWDDIEKGMNDEQLWAMLSPIDYNPANHMELLLHFVADQILTENKYSIIDYQRRDFHVISNYLGINTNFSPDQYADKVDNLWIKIRDAYSSIRNWYINNDYYHLIGLIVLMQGGSNPLPLIKEIYSKYTCKDNDKVSFIGYLEGEIGKFIQITEKTDESYNEDKRTLQLNELEYGKHNPRIIKILEVLNIYLYLNNKFTGSRFNFKKFKLFNVTSLEHIHPQHLNFQDNVKYEDVKSWYETIKKNILNNKEYCNDKSITASLSELEKLLDNKEQYMNNVKECQNKVEIIDIFFDSKACMNSGHMHLLYNMTLVDKNTNSALSNNLIDIKRNILQEREIETKTYVPLATNYVFNKHFSKEISDMKFWSKEDREAYFYQITTAYNYFINKINSDENSRI